MKGYPNTMSEEAVARMKREEGARERIYVRNARYDCEAALMGCRVDDYGVYKLAKFRRVMADVSSSVSLFISGMVVGAFYLAIVLVKTGVIH